MYALHYSFNNGPAYGLCSCGHTFDIPFELIHPGRSYEIDKLTMNCPHCGASFGRASRFYDANWWKYKQWDTKIGNSSKFVLSGTQEDENYFVVRKIVAEENDFRQLKVWSSTEITFSKIPKWTIEKVIIDGKEVAATKTNVQKCLTNVNHHFSRNNPHLFNYVGHILDSDAYSKILLALVEYPFLQAAYNKGKPRYKHSRIGLEFIVKGESSDQKALKLPKEMLKLFREGIIELPQAQYAVQVAGNELASQIVKELHETALPVSKDNILQFLKLTIAERRRLITYLTHDVNVYQGIEEAHNAWKLLVDYWRMQDKMEIKRELCPKSLKLQHDIAARNYKLILDENQHKAFLEQVQTERCQRLNWKSPDGKWFIQTFAEPDDLIREGSVQSHCAGSYVSYVIEGKYRMYSLRRTAEPNRPVLTLTVDKDNCCIFYKGYDNRDAMPEERAILEVWAKTKKLTLDKHG